MQFGKGMRAPCCCHHFFPLVILLIVPALHLLAAGCGQTSRCQGLRLTSYLVTLHCCGDCKAASCYAVQRRHPPWVGTAWAGRNGKLSIGGLTSLHCCWQVVHSTGCSVSCWYVNLRGY